jgi:SAM-dependent methyltransferase
VAHSSADPTKRFSDRVDAYVKARPRYPREVLDHLKSAIGLQPDWHIADIGSGTGISCELFLANGNPVTGIEPNAAMRSAAEASLRGFTRFRSINGSAEAPTLPDHGIDLAVAAQAFHWFNIPKTRRELARILRPKGHALLMWNDRRLGGTPFFEAYEQMLIDFGTDYLKVRHSNVTDAQLNDFFGPGGYRSAGFANHQHLDWEGLRARVLSSSYVPQNDERMLRRLREIFDRHNHHGIVTIEYQTELFYGHLTYNS